MKNENLKKVVEIVVLEQLYGNPVFTPGVIQELPAAICELCGKEDELRPYGPKGENICFDCGQKDVVTTNRMLHKKLFGT